MDSNPKEKTSQFPRFLNQPQPSNEPRLPNVSIFDVPTWTSVTDFQVNGQDTTRQRRTNKTKHNKLATKSTKNAIGTIKQLVSALNSFYGFFRCGKGEKALRNCPTSSTTTPNSTGGAEGKPQEILDDRRKFRSPTSDNMER